jgi:hypothetical protein
MRKFLADYSTTAAYGNQNHNFVILRYAGILLNYAEASNEVGNIDIAYDQLKALRKRAGIEKGSDDLYGLKSGMSQDEMRQAIRLERRIEMAFEEQRYWDVRRWKTAEQEFNKPLHGEKIIMNQDSTFTYDVVPASAIIFTAPRMYLYPIPYAETSGNKSIVQNPGW